MVRFYYLLVVIHQAQGGHYHHVAAPGLGVIVQLLVFSDTSTPDVYNLVAGFYDTMNTHVFSDMYGQG